MYNGSARVRKQKMYADSCNSYPLTDTPHFILRRNGGGTPKTWLPSTIMRSHMGVVALAPSSIRFGTLVRGDLFGAFLIPPPPLGLELRGRL